jgi:Fe-S-cluster containining protein
MSKKNKSGNKGAGPKARWQSKVAGNEKLDLFFRHLENLEIDLSDNELTVESYPPTQAYEHMEFEQTLSRVFDLEDEDYTDVRRAVEDLVSAVQAAMVEPNPDYMPDRCDRCYHSDCCHMGRIHLSEEERMRILAYLGEPDTEEVYDRYFEADDDLAGYYKTMFKHVKPDEPKDDEDTQCVFLRKRENGHMGCSIYEARPKVCRDYGAAYCDEFSVLSPDPDED